MALKKKNTYTDFEDVVVTLVFTDSHCHIGMVRASELHLKMNPMNI